MNAIKIPQYVNDLVTRPWYEIYCNTKIEIQTKGKKFSRCLLNKDGTLNVTLCAVGVY